LTDTRQWQKKAQEYPDHRSGCFDFKKKGIIHFHLQFCVYPIRLTDTRQWQKKRHRNIQIIVLTVLSKRGDASFIYHIQFLCLSHPFDRHKTTTKKKDTRVYMSSFWSFDKTYSPLPRDKTHHLFIFWSFIWWLEVNKFENSQRRQGQNSKLPFIDWSFRLSYKGTFFKFFNDVFISFLWIATDLKLIYTLILIFKCLWLN
jgi:hypothetical protein